MKKIIPILIFIANVFVCFGQDKNDSVNAKPFGFLIDFSIPYTIAFDFHRHSSGARDGYETQSLLQTDLAFGMIYHRHIFLAGICGGPSLGFANHYMDNGTQNGKVDYQIWGNAYSKWGLYGANLSYQFQFGAPEYRSKSSLIAYSSFSKYRIIRDDGYKSDLKIQDKNIFQFLIGYSYSRKATKVFSWGFQIIGGIFYNVDIIDYPNRIPDSQNFNHFEWVKMFPSFIFNPNISFKL